MRQTRLLYILIMCIFCFGCSSDEPEEICCTAELTVQLPTNDLIVLLRPDYTTDATFMRNINTGREYTIPTFVNNRTEVRVQKGVYILAFDGDATMADGTVRRVRCTGYSVMRESVKLLGDSESLTLTLTEL